MHDNQVECVKNTKKSRECADMAFQGCRMVSACDYCFQLKPMKIAVQNNELCVSYSDSVFGMLSVKMYFVVSERIGPKGCRPRTPSSG